MITINRCYCMDNLELMKQMEDESIDLIYCDILYGTGRNFGDFQDLKPDRQIIEDFYIPRIKEMHRVLKDTGSIYLHMDWRINHWIRCIMDDIFGYENFRNEIIWCYKSGGSAKTHFSRKHDNILFYTKSNIYTFNITKEKSYMLPSSGKNPSQTYYTDKDGRYTLVNTKDYWTDIGIMATSSYERVGYDTQKPKELLERIIKASSNEGDIVADFFCGSGTTGVVAKELGRNYIMCDINPKAIEISEQRLKKVSDND